MVVLFHLIFLFFLTTLMVSTFHLFPLLFLLPPPPFPFFPPRRAAFFPFAFFGVLVFLLSLDFVCSSSLRALFAAFVMSILGIFFALLSIMLSCIFFSESKPPMEGSNFLFLPVNFEGFSLGRRSVNLPMEAVDLWATALDRWSLDGRSVGVRPTPGTLPFCVLAIFLNRCSSFLATLSFFASILFAN